MSGGGDCFTRIETVMHQTHERIGDAFFEGLRAVVKPRQLRQICERNATEPDAGVCHSHDFCDANVVMERAFVHVLGREPDMGSDADVRTWNEAWDYAAAKHLGAKR